MSQRKPHVTWGTVPLRWAQCTRPCQRYPRSVTGARSKRVMRCRSADALGDLVGGQPGTRSVPNSSTLKDASAVP